MTSPLDLSRLMHDFEAVEVISDKPNPSAREAALWYVRMLRFPIFPCVPRGKRPLTAHGFHEATTDTAQVLEWWTRWPDANLATPTGPTTHGGCGFDVIDVDGAVGHATLAGLVDELPEVRAVAFTPGDPTKANGEPGRHLYVDATGDGNATRFAPGLDYRGQGGYVVLSPSMALHGVRYAWIEMPEVGR